MASQSQPESQPEYPPPLTPAQHDYLLTTFTDWSLSHGLTVRPPPSFVPENPNNALATHAPVTLFPSPFPRAPFNRAREIQTTYNELYANITAEENEEWLGGIIEEIAGVDDFIAQLWSVHQKVKAEGFVQDLTLGLFRSDYMIHKDPHDPAAAPEVLQVEFNTIASSFGGLATRVSELHRHLYRVGAYGDAPYINEDSLPDNPAMYGLADGLAEGHKAYGEGVVSRETAVLFLVQEGERNAFDQRWLEYSLLERHNIPSHRLTLAQIPTLTTLDPTTRALLYHPPHRPTTHPPIEISTIYFRSGYGPGDYPTPTAWLSRYHLERSLAIKCPSILTQLAGSKKIQQVLASPPPSSPSTPTQDILTHLLPRTPPRAIAALRASFAQIHPLSAPTPNPTPATALALNPTTARNFVLKPQREGGGNNIYKERIPAFLRGIPEEMWRGYILMEMIVPPGGVRNWVVRGGVLGGGEVVGELGVYGVCLWGGKRGGGSGEGGNGGEGENGGEGKSGEGERRGVDMRVNREVGWLLRTKGVDSEEGGVAAGFGCVDSVVLVD